MVLESLKQPVINGYLIAGSLVGPGGLKLVKVPHGLFVTARRFRQKRTPLRGGAVGAHVTHGHGLPRQTARERFQYHTGARKLATASSGSSSV